jgi:hypothetical protein
MLTNASPPCQVKEQDNDHDEQVNNINKIKKGVLGGSIPFDVADSGATSSVGTKRDRNRKAFAPTGQKSDKVFCMPNGKVEKASNMDELHHNVCHPAKDVHIMPGIKCNSLLSIPKFVDTNYIEIFDKDEDNIYDANKTIITVSCSGILQGWKCKLTKLWRIPLTKIVKNENTNTVLCNQCLTDFLPDRPPPVEVINNVYKLKTQPKLV